MLRKAVSSCRDAAGHSDWSVFLAQQPSGQTISDALFQAKRTGLVRGIRRCGETGAPFVLVLACHSHEWTGTSRYAAVNEPHSLAGICATALRAAVPGAAPVLVKTISAPDCSLQPSTLQTVPAPKPACTKVREIVTCEHADGAIVLIATLEVGTVTEFAARAGLNQLCHMLANRPSTTNLARVVQASLAGSVMTLFLLGQGQPAMSTSLAARDKLLTATAAPSTTLPAADFATPAAVANIERRGNPAQAKSTVQLAAHAAKGNRRSKPGWPQTRQRPRLQGTSGLSKLGQKLTRVAVLTPKPQSVAKVTTRHETAQATHSQQQRIYSKSMRNLDLFSNTATTLLAAGRRSNDVVLGMPHRHPRIAASPIRARPSLGAATTASKTTSTGKLRTNPASRPHRGSSAPSIAAKHQPQRMAWGVAYSGDPHPRRRRRVLTTPYDTTKPKNQQNRSIGKRVLPHLRCRSNVVRELGKMQPRDVSASKVRPSSVHNPVEQLKTTPETAAHEKGFAPQCQARLQHHVGAACTSPVFNSSLSSSQPTEATPQTPTVLSGTRYNSPRHAGTLGAKLPGDLAEATMPPQTAIPDAGHHEDAGTGDATKPCATKIPMVLSRRQAPFQLDPAEPSLGIAAAATPEQLLLPQEPAETLHQRAKALLQRVQERFAIAMSEPHSAATQRVLLEPAQAESCSSGTARTRSPTPPAGGGSAAGAQSNDPVRDFRAKARAWLQQAQHQNARAPAQSRVFTPG